MSCDTILSGLAFECVPLANQTYMVYTPFNMAHDGQVAAFSVRQVDEKYVLSDGCSALMHAEAHGVNVSRSRIQSLGSMLPSGVQLTVSGELTAECDLAGLAGSARSMVAALVGVTHQERAWWPATSEEEPFDEEVRQVLEPRVGSRLKRRVKVTGASGHQLELPFVIEGPQPRYNQTVPYDVDRLDWTKVYRALGKMLDIKNAGTPDESRIIIIEDAANDPQLDNAITLLAYGAGVYRFSRTNDWIDRLAA